MNLLRRRWLALVGAAMVLGFLAWGTWGRAPSPFPPAVVAPDTVVLEGRPVPGPIRWRDKLTTADVTPERQVTAGQPDSARVRAFARAVFRAESLEAVLTRVRETSGNEDTVAHETPLLPGVAGRYDGRALTLWLSRSDGSVLRATAKLRPHFDLLAGQGGLSDTMPIFRQDRAWVRVVREVKGCAAPTGVLALGGAALALVGGEKVARLPRWAAVAGGAGLLGCLAD